MENTLQRPPTPELQVLAWSRQLKAVKFNDFAALRFLSNATFSLQQARRVERSAAGRYVIAHEGIYALCLGTMYLHGMLPVGKEGQKELVVHWGCDRLLLPAPERNLIVDSRKLLYAIANDAADCIEDGEVRDLLGLGHKAMGHARRLYPDWFG
ncbi:MAG: hypothetical protein ACT4NV_19900 [Rhodoferax sp.]